MSENSLDKRNRETLDKSERIYLRRELQILFLEGKSFVSFPYHVVWYLYPDRDVFGLSGLSMMVSVPKKKFKHAVDRNRVKRLVRESFRKQKNPLQEKMIIKRQKLLVGFVFMGKELPSYKETYESIGKALKKLHLLV